MARVSIQKFIARNRAPRVRIEYDIELYGEIKKIQLPFVMGILADLSGKPAEPLPPVADRRFVGVDLDNFDGHMRVIRPRVAFQVPSSVTADENLAVDLTFESMDDFSPVAIARRVASLNSLLGARQQLAHLITYMDGKSGAEELVRTLLQDPTLLTVLATTKNTYKESSVELADLKSQQDMAMPKGAVGSEFDFLLRREFKPKTAEAEAAVEQAIRTLAQQALGRVDLVNHDVVKSIGALIAQLDKKLTEQINLILHHDDFQTLEAAWRGLHYLVNNTETDELLKIQFLNISKPELGKTLKRYKGTAWNQSPIFKKIYEAEYGQFGGEPFGCLVGDYYFDHRPSDVEILGEMARVAATAHTPFISGASPMILQMSSWQELAYPHDLTSIFKTPEYARWRSLRESDDSRYIGLAMPRCLARVPYGSETSPVEEFDFHEDTAAGHNGGYTWANAAYAMAVNINRSYKLYGWCSRIRGLESGGAVEGLPTHTFPTDEGGVDMKCPTEIAIGDRREGELAKNGLMPLVHRKNSDFAAFIGAQSLQKPFEYQDPEATANANLAARLSYLFPCCRFAHYLKCIVRDNIGSFRERADVQSWLQKWIMHYVDGDPANSSETIKAQKPLAAAEIQVSEIEGDPGYYSAKFFLRPQYQLEGLTTSLRLVSKLPSAKTT